MRHLTGGRQSRDDNGPSIWARCSERHWSGNDRHSSAPSCYADRFTNVGGLLSQGRPAQAEKRGDERNVFDAERSILGWLEIVGNAIDIFRSRVGRFKRDDNLEKKMGQRLYIRVIVADIEQTDDP